MAELKFIRNTSLSGPAPACCGTGQKMGRGTGKKKPEWITGTVATEIGEVPLISTELSDRDRWEHIRCRISAFRDSYAVPPGIYAVGAPDSNSAVLTSANYKLSFDTLRRALKGIDAWVLVLDTKGINVWCAAGKGTFGSDELITRISSSGLGRIVSHRNIVVPQLGAPGVSAHKVHGATGFRVSYGPVRAADIPAYLAAGRRAGAEMRRVKFGFFDRLILTPMEINPAMKKYFPLYAAVVLITFGLQPQGIIFRDAYQGGLPFLLLGLVAVFAGALLTPLLLPLIPSRSFAVKGWLMGMISVYLFSKIAAGPTQAPPALLIFTFLFFPLSSSYIALQFTGSTTFTGMSGVKKELKIALPVYIFASASSAIVLLLYKLSEWRIL